MNIRDELIDTLATADGQEISAMDLHTKRFMYGSHADAILARFAVVELPEPDYHGCWPAGRRARVMVTSDGRITDGYAIRETADDARQLAAALLAAAKYAEARS